MLNIEPDEVKQSIRLFKRTTRNMYLWDIQYKLWHERVATNSRLYQMNIKDTETCEYCQQRETNDFMYMLLCCLIGPKTSGEKFHSF